MNLICIICKKDAKAMYKGNSLCEEHVMELFKVASGDIFGDYLDVIIKRYDRKNTPVSDLPKADG